MDMLDIIARSHGGRGMQVLGAKFGLTERQTRAAVDQLAPAVMAGLRREVQSGPDGAAGLIKAIATGNHQRFLAGDDGIVDDGNAILGHVFKSKDVSRGVADRAAAASGVSADVLRKMLPVVTAMVMGGLSEQLIGVQPTTKAAATTASASRSTSKSTGTGTSTQKTAPAAAPARVSTARTSQSRATQASSTRPAAPAPAPAAKVAPGPAPATRASSAATPQPAPAQGGIGGLLGQLLGGGGASGASGAAAGGALGGIGGLLGQLMGGGGGGSGSASGGGIGDLLGGLLGGNSRPAAGGQASQSIGDLLSGLLGGGTASGNAADQLLDSVTRPRTGR